MKWIGKIKKKKFWNFNLQYLVCACVCVWELIRINDKKKYNKKWNEIKFQCHQKKFLVSSTTRKKRKHPYHHVSHKHHIYIHTIIIIIKICIEFIKIWPQLYQLQCHKNFSFFEFCFFCEKKSKHLHPHPFINFSNFFPHVHKPIHQ